MKPLSYQNLFCDTISAFNRNAWERVLTGPLETVQMENADVNRNIIMDKASDALHTVAAAASLVCTTVS